MKRRLGMLLTAALLTGLFALAPSTPAAAHVDVCAGVGSATVNTGGQGLRYVGSVYQQNLPFGFGFVLPPGGTCVLGTPFAPTGVVHGYCGLSAGSGSAAGHAFAFVAVGGVLVVSGGMAGTAVAAPDVTLGESCAPTDATGANNFLLVGLVVFTEPVCLVGPPGSGCVVS